MKALLLTLFAAMTGSATGIFNVPGVTSVSLLEESGADGTYNLTFPTSDARLSQQLAGALGIGNQDFHGAPNENYDVFFSDANGTLNPLGEYISIEASYVSLFFSGLNIDWVRLNFSGGGVEYANVVTSYVSSAAYVFGSENNVLGSPDGQLTFMGRTTGTDRMRVTVGFLSSSGAVPEPGTYILSGAGLAGIWVSHRKRRRTADAPEAAL